MPTGNVSPGFLGNRNAQDGSLSPQKQSSSLFSKYTLCNFRERGNYTLNNGYSLPTGATGDVNSGHLGADKGGVLPIDYIMRGAGQTLLAPAWSATGLDFSLDQTNDEGVEVVFGGSSDVNFGKHAFKINTDKAFFAKLKWTVEDVSGTDQCIFGFRKTQAAQTTYTGYTDYAVVGLVTNAGDIKTATRLNAGTASIVDTTSNWADTGTHTAEVRIAQDGVAAFLVDGAYALVTQSFTFDATDWVIPTFHFLHDTDVAGKVEFVQFECGYLPERAV